MKTTIAGLTILLLLAPVALYADHDDDDDDDKRGRAARVTPQLPPSEGLTQYRAECGSCHLAYPPQRGISIRRSEKDPCSASRWQAPQLATVFTAGRFHTAAFTSACSF